MLRLDLAADHISGADAEAFARFYEGYWEYMTGFIAFDPDYIAGIYKIIAEVYTYQGSDKKPREIVREISKKFAQRDGKADVTDLFSIEDRKRRRRFIQLLVPHFHPDGTKDLPSEEQQRRTAIFKNRISPAIQEESSVAVERLEQIAREEGLLV